MGVTLLPGISTPVAVAVIGGGATATALGPCGGLVAADDLVCVRHISDDLVTNDDVTSEASISAEGAVELSTTTTTGDFLVVVWKKAA